VPLALGAGEPGKEIQQPMAVVILGGIATSTFLNMIVIPALYLKYSKAAAAAPTRDYPGEGEMAPARDWDGKSTASEIERGACVLITADGLGPARVAKAGAVALSSATATPVFAVGADSHPALSMPHKWDATRIPLPFGRLAMAINEARHCPDFTDTTSIENARLWLQQALRESPAHSEITVLVEASRIATEPSLAGVLPHYRAMPCSHSELVTLARRRLASITARWQAKRLL